MEKSSRTGSELKEEEEEAECEIWNIVFGFTKMAIVKCAIQLGIPEAIENHQTPITLESLSTVLHCSPTLLHRVMRFLVHHKIFKEQPTKHGLSGYTQTPLSRLLIKDRQKSLASFILLESNPIMLAPWQNLSISMLLDGANKPPFDRSHGKDIWSYATDNKDHNELINDAMACDARLAVTAMIEKLGDEVLGGIRSLVDVGGGKGTSLGKIVKAYPDLKCINFDLPHVVDVADRLDGVENIGGDMFDFVPKADAVLIKWVLHDWNDEDCIKILKKCREAIPKDKGKVMILEAVIGEEQDNKLEFVRLMLDMVMLAHTSQGKERTEKEWAFVLKEAGFSHYSIKRIGAVQHLIEAYPSLLNNK